jgi:hypothetical protein
MAREARGIEVFGRGATVVEVGPAAARTPALGGAAVLVAILAAAALVGAVIERSDLFTWIALGASAVAVLCGFLALLSGRGRLAGLLAMLLGAIANPWLLSLALHWFAGLPTS